MNLPCSIEQAAPFAHIADELIAVAARINAHRDASCMPDTSDKPSRSGRRAASAVPQQAMQAAGPQLQQQHGDSTHEGVLLWDAERLQCVWRHVQHYHVQLNGQRPDIMKLTSELGTVTVRNEWDALMISTTQYLN